MCGLVDVCGPLFFVVGSVGDWEELVCSDGGDVLLPFDRVAFERSGEAVFGVSLHF